MSWFSEKWAGIMDFIHSSSWVKLSWIIAGVIVILLSLAVVSFWWLILHKFMNRGDH